MINRLIIFMIFVFGLLLPSIAHANIEQFNRYYGELLRVYVQDMTIDGVETSAVNYKDWRKDERHKLAMKALQASPTPDNYKDALAFWINAYNFLTIDVILQNDETLESITYAEPYYQSPFSHYNWTINNNTVTLNYIENTILRATGEGFLAVVLTKAAIYSPDLRKEPYEAEKILDQISDQAREFLGNPKKGMTIEEDGIYLSRVFENYETLFGGMQGIFNFVLGHAPYDKIPNNIKGFKRFDWDLNGFNTH